MWGEDQQPLIGQGFLSQFQERLLLNCTYGPSFLMHLSLHLCHFVICLLVALALLFVFFPSCFCSMGCYPNVYTLFVAYHMYGLSLQPFDCIVQSVISV
jgi:hypothetical protein